MALTDGGLIKVNGSPTSGRQYMENAVADTDYQSVLAEGAFADGDKTKLDSLSAGGGGFAPAAVTDVSTAQTWTTGNLGNMYRFTTSVASDLVNTLPSVGASEDANFLWVENGSIYKITVNSSDSDYFANWPELTVKGIDVMPGATVLLMYDDTSTRWKILAKTGSGKVWVAGTMLYLDDRRLGDWGDDNNQKIWDATGRHAMYATISGSQYVGQSKFGQIGNQAGVLYNGSADYLLDGDSSDWDICSNTGNIVTADVWAKFDNTASAQEWVFGQYGGASARWHLSRTAAGAFNFYYFTATTALNATGGTLNASTWYHLAFILDGSGIGGIYVDGVQVGFDNSWTAGTIAGNFYVGQYGTASGYFDGTLNDLGVCMHNIYNATPNTTPDDSFTPPTKPKDLVIY